MPPFGLENKRGSRRVAGTSAHARACLKSQRIFLESGRGIRTPKRIQKRLPSGCVEVLGWAHAHAQRLGRLEFAITGQQLARELCCVLGTAKNRLRKLEEVGLAEQVVQGSREYGVASEWIIRPRGVAFCVELKASESRRDSARGGMSTFATSTPCRGTSLIGNPSPKDRTPGKRAASPGPRRVCRAVDPVWAGCLGALGELGEVKPSAAIGAFKAQELSPDQACLVIRAAGAQGRARSVRNLVGYALQALRDPEWSKRLLAPPAPEVDPVESSDLQAAAEEIAANPRGRVIQNPGAFVAHLIRTKPADLVERARKVRARREDEARAAGDAPRGLRGDSEGLRLFGVWRRIVAMKPDADSPGFLDHLDSERKAYRALVGRAEIVLGARAEALRLQLRGRMVDPKVPEGTPVWRMAWDHHWGKAVLDALV